MDAVQPAMHGRDHCPGGTDPIPCLTGSSFRAVFHTLDADPIEVSSSLVDIPYVDWVNGSTEIFSPKTSLGADPVAGTDLVQNVLLLRTGRYVISWGVYFTDSFTGDVGMYIHDDDPIFGRPDVALHPFFSGGLETGYLTHTIARYYPLIDPFTSGSHTPKISTDASQTSGSSQTVTEAWLEIHYQGA